MIPLRLTLKNFLSYGPQEQTINFEPYHLICLSGKNGHGKSALLDAITWAVWGAARKISGVAKADADIVRLGQTFMMVSFDFSFNGQTYRIKREYGKTFAKPYSSCEFGIFDAETEKIKSLTDKTIRATQEKIEKTIGLDYESFINTAFLRQGQANEFSKKSPKERKDILASILNLHHYEELRKIAQERVRTAESKKLHLIAEQTALKEELQGFNAVLEKVDTLTHSYNALMHKEHDLKQEHEALALTIKKQDEQLQSFNLIKFHYTQLVHDETKKQKDLFSNITHWRSINSQLRILPDHTLLEHEKRTLQDHIKKQQDALQQHLEQKELYLQIKEEEQAYITEIRKIHTEQVQQQTLSIERLHAEKKAYTTELSHYQALREKIEHETQEIEKQCAILEKQKKENSSKDIIKFEEKFEKRKAYYHSLIARLQQIHNEQGHLAQKQQLTQDRTSPSCPLCEQNLSASRKGFLKTKFAESARFYLHRRTRLESIAKNLKVLLIEQHTALQAMQKQSKEEQIRNIQLEELKKNTIKLAAQLQDSRAHETKIAYLIKDIEQKSILEKEKFQALTLNEKQLLAHNKEYTRLKQERIQLEEALKSNSSLAAELQKTVKQLEEIEKKLQEHHAILNEKSLQKERYQNIIHQIQQLKELKKTKQELMQQLSVYATKEEEKISLKEKQVLILENLTTIQRAKEQLLQEKGRLEQQKIYLDQQQKKYTAQEQQLQELTNHIFEYSAIATALSKNGIQALLIEDAIPEIEHEANFLLGQLTDNQTHIMIESVRDLKKGGSRETLDINISDPMGIRPYELFSGGEAFRIDFALRIAISKLLARRSGTSLQTLIIDEGFGSQDEEGLSRLMDSIYKIQDNFNKVIIVSHLSALKEQFPVHFVISKGPQGSTVTIVEQG